MTHPEIVTVEEAGFCFGVRRALQLAQQATDNSADVYCLGPPIHNRQVVEGLEARGLRVVEDIDDVEPGATALVRARLFNGTTLRVIHNGVTNDVAGQAETVPYLYAVPPYRAREVRDVPGGTGRSARRAWSRPGRRRRRRRRPHCRCRGTETGEELESRRPLASDPEHDHLGGTAIHLPP